MNGLRTAVALGVSAVLLMSGCALSGLAFEQDQRLQFEAPSYRQKVNLPYTIRWSMSDFQVTGETGQSAESSGYFEVLFDTGPQPPNEGVDYFARDDRSCVASDGCPDRHYLAQQGVYTTTDQFFRVHHLAPAPGVDLSRGQPDIHDVTIVLLNGAGKRIGESSWTTSFEIIHD
ncbi:MAG: hypothetical protein ABR579_09430 [Actinomycetota bacterium]